MHSAHDEGRAIGLSRPVWGKPSYRRYPQNDRSHCKLPFVELVRNDRTVPSAVYRGSPDNVGFRADAITTLMSTL